MKKAALITYNQYVNRIMFWLLGKPEEIGSIDIRLEGEVFRIIILASPFVESDKNKIKQKTIIDKYLRDNSIQYALYADEKDEALESKWSTIKAINIIKRIGEMVGENLFNESYGIISTSLDIRLIEALSKEASSMMILKTEENNMLMDELHKKIIKETGLSIAFVESAEDLIKHSRIVIYESEAIADRCKSLLSFPIMVNRIMIWPERIEDWNIENIKIIYREEIGKLIIKLLSNDDIWDITEYFPYLYFLNDRGENIGESYISTDFKGYNKALTIQKC